MDTQDHPAEQSQPTPSWGDTVMPDAAAQRQARMRELHAHDSGSDPVDSRPVEGTTGEQDSGTPADDPLLYAGGRPIAPDDGPLPPYTTPLPQTDTLEGNWSPLLGPGNEAMADGASPAPRGYTGGAMGRVVSGLSPSFPEAATGAPPESAAPGAAATNGDNERD